LKRPQNPTRPRRRKLTTHAATIATELASDEGWEGFSVVVKNQDGHEVARVSIHLHVTRVRAAPDARAAVAHAARVAKELSKGKRRAGLRKTLAVMDEQGNELAVIRISSAARLSQR
jgi:hypothetical protein